MSYIGEEGGRFVWLGVLMGDLGGGIFVVYGVLVVFYQWEKIGFGQKIDVSMFDCQIYFQVYWGFYYFYVGEVVKLVGFGYCSVIFICVF